MTASPSVQIFYKKQNCKLCQQKCTIRTKTVACISSEASEGHGDNIKRLCISKSFLGSNGVLRWLGGNINLGKSQESSTPIWEKSAQVRANEDDLQARKFNILKIWLFNLCHTLLRPYFQGSPTKSSFDKLGILSQPGGGGVKNTPPPFEARLAPYEIKAILTIWATS